MKYIDIIHEYNIRWLMFITEHSNTIPWGNISHNENITLRILKEYRHLPWDTKSIQSNPNMDMNTVQSINKLWNAQEVSKNINITKEIIDNYPDHNWDWNYALSRNPSTTWEIIYKFSHVNWDWKLLFENDKIPLKYINIINKDIIEWEYVSKSKYITIDFIIKHKRKLNWYYISNNAVITWDIIQENIDLPWNWEGVSSNSNITLDIIKNNKFYRWYYTYWGIYSNPNITLNYIISIVPYNQSLVDVLSWVVMHTSNPTLSMDILNRFPDLNWDWEFISYNQNITLSFIEKHINKPWDWNNLSKNPHLTIDFIKKHSSYSWDWKKLVSHPMKKCKKQWIYRFERIAANRIHRFWRDVCYNPEYEYCRKRINDMLYK